MWGIECLCKKELAVFFFCCCCSELHIWYFPVSFLYLFNEDGRNSWWVKSVYLMQKKHKRKIQWFYRSCMVCQGEKKDVSHKCFSGVMFHKLPLLCLWLKQTGWQPFLTRSETRQKPQSFYTNQHVGQAASMLLCCLSQHDLHQLKLFYIYAFTDYHKLFFVFLDTDSSSST